MSPRRRDGELGPALNTDRLLDDLLRAAEAGNLPLASEEECRAWVNAWGATWRAARRARGLSDYGTDARGRRCWVYAPQPPWSGMPVGIARRYAINYIELIPSHYPPAMRHRAEERAREAWAREHPKPPADADSHGRKNADEWAWTDALAAYMAEHREAFDLIEAHAAAECRADVDYLIARFKLKDLVRVAPVPAPDDPTAPSPAARAEPGAQEIP